MRPFRSVGGRLALALLLVVAGVLTIVYLIVVPSYKTSLENNELRTLETLLRTRAVPGYPAEPWMKQQYASTQAPRLNARVVVFNLQNETPALLVPYADSNLEGNSTDVLNDPVAIALTVALVAAAGSGHIEASSIIWTTAREAVLGAVLMNSVAPTPFAQSRRRWGSTRRSESTPRTSTSRSRGRCTRARR